ncbi:Aldehyde/histidinol dehydrogenase [Talaromyces proteolyticus]|uniref:Aldehyde/histidinol dehydrogenase n=1 Tax=Talaromyces proteolyticus TaxID=1131652 RepID=A0AAD4KHE9_9EURO|nr:Aldehyde/histidinol dehydrogenase [Talaromyces proteolyticus]KAH8691277.1 Aldehyde/histidinol dehydrogenase [Talaromyces proteolyticus]
MESPDNDEYPARHGLVPLIVNNNEVVTEITFEVISPLNNKAIYRSSAASAGEAIGAVDAAHAAFSTWSKTSPAERRTLFSNAADLMLSQREVLSTYQYLETGSDKKIAEHTVMLGVDMLRALAGVVSLVEGILPTVANVNQSAVVLKEPYGVVLGIAPWNAPFILGTRAIAIPLAAGNTVVLKGSELSPKCFWALGDIFRQAGFPKGSVNVIYSRREDAEVVTNKLISHPSIRKINFTGSTNVGSSIASLAGQHLKPLVLELGGKAPCIVLDDANLQKAAVGCVSGSFMNVSSYSQSHSGQICMATERIIVQRSIANEFRCILVNTAERMFGTNAPLMTLISVGALEKIKGLVSDAVSKGAQLVFQADAIDNANATHMGPTIITGLEPGMKLYYAESFGPVASLHVVETEEDAVALANDTQHGLTAALYTEDLARAWRLAKRLESGAVHINSPTIHDEFELPHGGYKDSGFGRFGGGPRALDEFLQTKVVTWMD